MAGKRPRYTVPSDRGQMVVAEAIAAIAGRSICQDADGKYHLVEERDGRAVHLAGPLTENDCLEAALRVVSGQEDHRVTPTRLDYALAIGAVITGLRDGGQS